MLLGVWAMRCRSAADDSERCDETERSDAKRDAISARRRGRRVACSRAYLFACPVPRLPDPASERAFMVR